MRYVHTDHLGSVSVATNDLGQVVERLAYDAWGKRRQPNGADDPNNAIRPALDRGYTGHEQLDAGGMGLVHMNARLYDPQLGRVLSPDPIIQAPGFSQSFNRYSYVWNNPLRFFDPGGYFVVDANGGAGVLGTPLPQDELAYYVAPGGTTPRRSVLGMGEAASGSAAAGASAAGASGGSAGAGQTSANNTTFNVSNDSSGFHFSSTTTYTNTSGGNGCTTNCTLVGTPYDGGGGTASGGNSQDVASSNGIIAQAGSASNNLHMEQGSGGKLHGYLVPTEWNTKETNEGSFVKTSGAAEQYAVCTVCIYSGKGRSESGTGDPALDDALGGNSASLPPGGPNDDEKGDKNPEVRRIHSDETIKFSNKSGYDYWSKRSTDEIVKSLRPGQEEPLTVKPDGRIFQGNTRALILQERGFDINTLPKVTIP